MTEARAGEEPADLTDAERLMWRSYRTGDVCDLTARERERGGAADRDRSPEADDPHGPRVWGPSAPCAPAWSRSCCSTARRRCPAGWPR